jgi:hypothetical protein
VEPVRVFLQYNIVQNNILLQKGQLSAYLIFKTAFLKAERFGFQRNTSQQHKK